MDKIESSSHQNDFLVIINDYFLEMGLCYVTLHLHSIEIICLGWKVGSINSTAIR